MYKLFISLGLITSLNANLTNVLLEKDYVNKYCKGQIEFKLKDDTRVDCLTDDTAYEFDFARKWYESIGQSLYYSYMTNKQAGIYLIVTKPSDYRYVNRAKVLCEKHNIKLEIIEDLRGR